MAIAVFKNINYFICFVSLILYLLTRSEASTDIQEVRLVHKLPENIDLRYTVEIDKPLNIIFEKQYMNKTVTCWKNINKNTFLKNQPAILFPLYNESYLSVSTVSRDMSTKWICATSYNNYCPNCNMKNEVYSFEMHVKGAMIPDVWIWGRNITNSSKLTDRSVTEYDFIFIYEYEDGETIDYTCTHNEYHGKLRLEYYDANDTEVFRTDEVCSRVISFRPSMKAKDIGSYVDCIYITPSDMYLQEFIHRTKFMLKNKISMSNFIVSINDIKLQPMHENLINGINLYYYKFIPGEILKLSCEKTTVYSEKVHLDVFYKNEFQGNIANDITGTFLINTKHLDGGKLLCFSYKNTSAATMNALTYIAASIELHKASDRDPIILGLPDTGILYQYRKNETSWVTHYKFVQNQMLNLTCKSTTNKILKWASTDVPMQSLSNKYKTYTYAELYLNASYNNAKIICEAQRKGKITRRQVIVLHQELEALENGQDDTPRMIVIFGCVSISLVAIITAICVFCWFKRIRNFIPKESPYENFNNSESPIPAYLQDMASSDFINISSMLYNSLYISSDDNRNNTSNNITENHYTEIVDQRTNEEVITTLEYAVPYEELTIKDKETNSKACIEKDYAEIVDQRTNEKVITTLEYAVPCKGHEELTIKDKGTNSKACIEKDYAEIVDQRTNEKVITTLEYAVPCKGYEELTIKDKGTNSKACTEKDYAEIEDHCAYENVMKRPSPYENYDFRFNFSSSDKQLYINLH